MSHRHPSTLLPQQPAKFCFVQASWHADIVNKGRDAFVAEMGVQGVAPENIDLIEVPGAFEIPLHAQQLARSGRYAAIVACGLVVDGGIYRHEFVADAVISGLMRVQLDTGVPVFSAVLTPQHFHEHEEHRRFFTEHFLVKGKEVAQACVRTLASLQQLHELQELAVA
ncbi:MAG: 6,7-dimethyl-8-ribityllumazine synthase [Pseudomonadota bacterium]|uniref:6,7-dimethyl-8-ribityllumazine synthase n=1 Tax=Polaromonas sp. TaxID=1869339 RepID=UPI0017EED031|nr:6,7-dimethyl-8-ribityllumazine synthase [Polaromonas sp.]MBA3592691.1 6,7-dimethyl-8-ribityllumazine synthase [Polaromonas sp.]MDQ3272268.1 6,7-dimethyl-8-ribityllumazine synthase [Pseudomonadota bacterium]